MLASMDTIVAPATPSGEGGVAMVRLSGSLARQILAKNFRLSTKTAGFESHRLYHGHLVDARGDSVDEVMAVFMRAPRTYTREDVVEVFCHGGSLLVRRIVDLFVGCGARIAQPGEFTLRAFLNGRIDLSQAEAVMDLISARSEAAGKVALGQLNGALSKELFGFKDTVSDLLAMVEAAIDFPEEDLDVPVFEEFRDGVLGIRDRIDLLLEGFDSGRALREGLSVLILGRPNVGKSSLLNALLGEARAIVTPIPGTTRDTIEEALVLGGFPLRLIDTAGIRETVDTIEAEGVRRAREKISGADLVLLVVDGSRPLEADDLLALDLCRGQRVLLVINKDDLPQAPHEEKQFLDLPQVRISVHNGNGLDILRSAVVGLFSKNYSGDDAGETILLSDRRHRQALVRCREALLRGLDGLAPGCALEVFALELREALHAIGEITGETTPDTILEKIFSRFCVGK